jgi:hypothetical protein
MTPAIRQKIEREIIGAFVKDALAKGYRLAVSLDRGYDVEDMLLGSRDQKKIVDEAMSGTNAYIFIQSAEGPLTEEGVVLSEGWVYVVLGNDGWDVISDYTINLEELMVNANRLSDKYSK